ncbi:hypothetical protein, partial [uncultured Megasphaera sp.]|uniref:hypothetical protein n=1 Tax=uncultured Megasphaera sp. TaxID=165188 RepID=UPI00262B0A60
PVAGQIGNLPKYPHAARKKYTEIPGLSTTDDDKAGRGNLRPPLPRGVGGSHFQSITLLFLYRIEKLRIPQNLI